MIIEEVLSKQGNFTREDIIFLLKTEGDDRQQLFKLALETKLREVGKNVYFRGLIELSNSCCKDCLYCGIRKSNKKVARYNLTDEQVLDAARFAHDNKYGSLVIQAGELASAANTKRITDLVKEIKNLSGNQLGITLSLGEQTRETYEQWFAAGAHRYLLRIEASNKELYQKLHPTDAHHRFEKRLECLKWLKQVGYQTGTGVMIGLPYQDESHLAEDLLFMKELDADMVGMGPYILHQDTPLYFEKDSLWPEKKRFDYSLKMIAILRLMMPDINMAASTAMQTLDKMGREKAVKVGANIIMPNITPGTFRDSYALYENKPCTDENPEDCIKCLEARVALTGHQIGLGKWGDSKRYRKRKNGSARNLVKTMNNAG